MKPEEIKLGDWFITESGDFDDCVESFSDRDEAVAAGLAEHSHSFFVGQIAVENMEPIYTDE